MIEETGWYRQELVRVWKGFLNACVTRDDAIRFVESRMADYGPEEIVHEGLQLLNDALARPDEHSQAVNLAAFASWQREAALFDDDPRAWNRAWAIASLTRILPHVAPSRRLRVIDLMGDKLTASERDEIACRFVAPSDEDG